jgi:hypothetical protein
VKEMNAQSATLTVAPSNAITVGSPMNLTCVIDPMPLTNDIYLALANGGLLQPIIRISTIVMRAMVAVSLYGRIAIDMVNNVTFVIEYAYTTSADAGDYQCLVLSSVTSNQLAVAILPSTTGSPTSPENNVSTPPPPTQTGRTMLAVQSEALTTPPSWNNNLGVCLNDSQQTIIIWVIVTLAAIAVVFGVTLIALRLKYKDRFCMVICRRKQKRARAHLPNTGTGNSVFAIDDQQLPSYTDAVKCAVNVQSLMPPNYTDAVYAKQEAQNNEQKPAENENVTIY